MVQYIKNAVVDFFFKTKIPSTKKMKKKNDQENDFYGHYFCLMFKSMNFAILFYVVLSAIMYLLVHFYGKQIITSKLELIEYDNLLYVNLFNDIFFVFLLVLGIFCFEKEINNCIFNILDHTVISKL